MFKFTKTHILYVIVLIFFILIQVFINQHEIKTEINENIMEENQEIVDKSDCSIVTEKTESEEENDIECKSIIEEQKEIKQTENWQIEIPKISLIANIQEGTSKEILSKYVGHFTTTQREIGNVGLAAHNRGYEVNYFKNLKLLKEGDEIKYKYNGIEKIYEVEKCRIIKDTEWKYLKNTEDNRLTLITCVENQPEYRRCIQAVEKEEVKH